MDGVRQDPEQMSLLHKLLTKQLIDGGDGVVIINKSIVAGSDSIKWHDGPV